MSKLIVEYDPEHGEALPDNRSKVYVNDAITNRHVAPHIVVGTDLLIILFRCAVVKGKINHTELEFLFEGTTIKVDKHGMCSEWPKGFCDIPDDALNTLLFYQHKNKPTV